MAKGKHGTARTSQDSLTNTHLLDVPITLIMTTSGVRTIRGPGLVEGVGETYGRRYEILLRMRVGGGAAGGAAPVATPKKGCSFQGASTGHGETYEGHPTHTCTCANGKWVTCVMLSDSAVVSGDDSISD